MRKNLVLWISNVDSRTSMELIHLPLQRQVISQSSQNLFHRAMKSLQVVAHQQTSWLQAWMIYLSRSRLSLVPRAK